MSIHGPVVIDENGDLEVFPDAERAVAGLEAIDVLNDEYDAFDSQGEPLDLLVVNDLVILRRRADPETDRDDVVRRLRRAATAYDRRQIGDLDIEHADLEELIAALLTVKPLPLTWKYFLPWRHC